MATESPQISDGSQVTAAADLSAKQFYCVKLTAARAVNLSGAGDASYGILQNKPISGEVCDVALFGISKAVAGAATTAGGPLMIDSSGRVIDKTSTNTVVAMGLEAATATGQIITVKIVPTAG